MKQIRVRLHPGVMFGAGMAAGALAAVGIAAGLWQLLFAYEATPILDHERPAPRPRPHHVQEEMPL
ncbi:MAG: hypothetical protein ACYDBQ_03270 [Thermoplasmatota archaeon]